MGVEKVDRDRLETWVKGTVLQLAVLAGRVQEFQDTIAALVATCPVPIDDCDSVVCHLGDDGLFLLPAGEGRRGTSWKQLERKEGEA